MYYRMHGIREAVVRIRKVRMSEVYSPNTLQNIVHALFCISVRLCTEKKFRE